MAAVKLSQRHRPLWVGLSALGAAFLVASFIPPHGWDLVAFGNVDLADPYGRVGDDLSGAGAFRYAPPLVLVLAPLAAMPWDLLLPAWLALQLAALWYIGREWALALIVFPPVWLDLVYGNINILLAAMVVAGFRHPWVWTFALLSKVTPGIGLLWFVIRREWRSLALVVAATAAVSIGSVALVGPGMWGEWIGVLRGAAGMPAPFDALPIPLLPRLVLAAVIVSWGAVDDRRWTIPVAVTLAMPTLWAIAFAPVVAVVALAPTLIRTAWTDRPSPEPADV